MIQKQKLVVIIIFTSLALVGWLSATFGLLDPSTAYFLQLSSAILALCAIGFGAVKALLRHVFGMDVLATVAILASIVSGEYLPAVVVAIMLLGGEMLEDYAQRRASSAIRKLIEAQPQTATVLRNGQEVQIKPEEVKLGETVIVKPGAKIPIDGVIQKGFALINQASVTGESVPSEKAEGELVFSGTLIMQGAIYVTATAVGERSTYGRIIAMVKEAEAKRAPIERTTDRYAKYFTPGILALGLAVFAVTQDTLRMAAIFIIACPCALTLATPTAVVASIGNAAKKGIIIRNGETLEKLSKVDMLIVDKTGTITRGELEVVGIKSFGKHTTDEILQFAARVEKCSEHPFAKAILKKALQQQLVVGDSECFEHYPGLGVRIENGVSSIIVGNERLLKQYYILLTREQREYFGEQANLTVVLVAKGKTVVGAIRLADRPRENINDILAKTKENGVKEIMMLTGDNDNVARAVAKASGIDESFSNMMPADKVDQIQKLRNQGHTVAMIGDGVNDAPALTAANVGIAMGVSGTEVAIETAGIVLAQDNLQRLPQLLQIGKKTMSIIKQNIAFALAINVIGIVLSTQGLITPLIGSAIHESNALIVMMNSLRLLWVK